MEIFYFKKNYKISLKIKLISKEVCNTVIQTASIKIIKLSSIVVIDNNNYN